MTLPSPSAEELSYIDNRSREYNDGRESPGRDSFSVFSKVLIFLLPVTLIIICLLTRAPLIVLATTVVALSPVALAVYVVTRLGDADLPKSFLVEQLFWGAVPAFIGAALTETVLLLLPFFTFFRADLKRIANMNIKDGKFDVRQLFGVWEMILLALYIAYVVAACVEESAKVMVGSRSKKFISGGSRDANISARSMVAAVVAGALGLAATEHFFYTLQMFLATRRQNTASHVIPVLIATGLSLSRAALALPVHCGTGLLIGVAMAKKFVMKQNVKIFWTFLMAVFVHGTFDAVTMVIMGLKVVKVLPAAWWPTAIMIVSDISITIGLMLMCRSAYKSLANNNGYATLRGDAIV